jgi:hypothetical protein
MIIEALFKEETSLTVDQAIETTISGSYLGIEGVLVDSVKISLRAKELLVVI